MAAVLVGGVLAPATADAQAMGRAARPAPLVLRPPQIRRQPQRPSQADDGDDRGERPRNGEAVEFLWEGQALEEGPRSEATPFVRLTSLQLGIGLHADADQTASTYVGNFNVTLGQGGFLQLVAGFASSQLGDDRRARGGNPALLGGYGGLLGKLQWAVYGGATAPVASGTDAEDFALWNAAVGIDLSRSFLWGPDSMVVGAGGRLGYPITPSTVVFQTALPGVSLPVRGGGDPLLFVFHTTGLIQHLVGPLDVSAQFHGQFVNTSPDPIYATAAEVGLSLTSGHHKFGPRFSLPLTDPYGIGSGDYWGVHFEYTLLDPGSYR